MGASGSTAFNVTDPYGIRDASPGVSHAGLDFVQDRINGQNPVAVANAIGQVAHAAANQGGRRGDIRGQLNPTLYKLAEQRAFDKHAGTSHRKSHPIGGRSFANPPSQRMCTKEYSPVKATNGRIYGNMCELENAGATPSNLYGMLMR